MRSKLEAIRKKFDDPSLPDPRASPRSPHLKGWLGLPNPDPTFIVIVTDSFDSSGVDVYFRLTRKTTLKRLFEMWAKDHPPALFLTNTTTHERANNPESLRKVINFARSGDRLVMSQTL